jgi:hypothetical protein
VQQPTRSITVAKLSARLNNIGCSPDAENRVAIAAALSRQRPGGHLLADYRGNGSAHIDKSVKGVSEYPLCL